MLGKTVVFREKDRQNILAAVQVLKVPFVVKGFTDHVDTYFLNKISWK
jgi:hypothetical protein